MWEKGLGFKERSLPDAGLPSNAIAPGKLAVDLHHLFIEVLEALRHLAKSIRLLLGIDDYTVGHEASLRQGDPYDRCQMADKALLAQGGGMNHGVEAHKALVPHLYGTVNDCSVGDRDILSQLDGASLEAVKDGTVLNVAFIADDYGAGFIRPQGYGRGHINILADAHIAYDCGGFVHIG